MKQLTIFRILTFILVPIAAMFGFMDLLILVNALANPGFLFVAFIIAAFVIYTFTSLQFLTRGIDTGRPLKRSLRDWIRVNAYASGFMGIMSLVNASTMLFASDDAMRQLVTRALESQANLPPMLNVELFVKIMRAATWFMAFVSVVLLSHIVLNFRMMKKYQHLFVEPQA